MLLLLLQHRDAHSARLPDGHLAKLCEEEIHIADAMRQYLCAPTVSHTRHVLTASGRRRHALVGMAKRRLLERITRGFIALSLAARDVAGIVDGGRLSVTLQTIMSLWEQLRYLKAYRSAQATRVYSHVAVWAHAFIFGPYYAWCAEAADSRGDESIPRLGYAIFLAVATAVSLSALLNARLVLEDPFVGTVDSVKTDRELDNLVLNLRAVYQGY